jgi:hypothetical protein
MHVQVGHELEFHQGKWLWGRHFVYIVCNVSEFVTWGSVFSRVHRVYSFLLFVFAFHCWLFAAMLNFC